MTRKKEPIEIDPFELRICQLQIQMFKIKCNVHLKQSNTAWRIDIGVRRPKSCTCTSRKMSTFPSEVQ